VLGDGTRFGVRIKYVEQEKRLGIAHAVGQLEACIDRPFMLFLGDIFFELTDLDAMVREMEQHGAAAVLAVREETEPEAVKRNFCVITRQDGSVRRVIEKPRQLPCMTKGCGLYLFDLAIFDAIRHTPRTAMRDEYEITDSIQILIDYEYPVRIAPVVEFDINVTYIGDLITCSRHVLHRKNLTRLVGNGCRLASGVELVETVLGDNVVVSKPARLERCVVLSGVTLEGGIDYQDAVIAPEGILRPYHEA
jgi:dTDP-glucose pyrophosphorylase